MDKSNNSACAIAADIGDKIFAFAELPQTTAKDCERLNEALATIAKVARDIDGRQQAPEQATASESA